jgi:hypothetical protein
MAQANHAYITSKFHNLSNEALAGAIGHKLMRFSKAQKSNASIHGRAARALGQRAVHKMPIV